MKEALGYRQSMMLSKDSFVLKQITNAIGFRVGFFGKDGQVSDTMSRDRDAQIYGPMAGVGVTLGGYIPGGYGVTDSNGKYSMNYFLPSCPGFVFEYTTPAFLELQYKRFNPRGGSYMPYYMTRQDYDVCNGLGVYSLSAAMVIATAATPIKRPMDFPVDLMVIDGAAAVKGAKVGDSTAYSAETSDRARTLQEKYDFDGDEKPEFVVPGKKVTKQVEGKPKEVFVTTSVEEAELQGIYLSSRYDSAPTNTEETAPDFTRLIDTTADFKDRGLLESITTEDLKDTDIYVFRESNGQLVAERRGLHENELYKTYSGVDDGQGAFRFTIQLRGSAENFYSVAGRTGEANFTKWQSAGGFKEEFQKRTANHLKAGEQVRIIAINRPTGYIGSKTFQLQSSLSGNLINLNSQQIQMGPPNLKIWAERKSKIESGMTKGDEKKQLIGNEGAGLGSDISIAIYSDWRDADGSPLPEELADYGYTGRLAKIVAANQLAPVGANSLSQFQIKPGQQVQVIQLPEKVLAKQHLYLQVAGQPENRNPDFSSEGAGKGILKYRPTRYVPVLVPLHDEETSELARQAYRKANKEFPELDLKKPEPVYSWQYRSELQFSLYDLNVNGIRRETSEGLDVDVLVKKNPVITSSDSFVKLLYELLASNFEKLGGWDAKNDRELVFALGEQEIKATIGEDKGIRFDNISHLGNLSPDDFLSLRLYANNDVGNTLWEWAFEYFKIDTQLADVDSSAVDKVFVSADSPEIDLQAVLVGYSNRKEENKTPLTASWSVNGDGFLGTNKEAGNLSGTFFNTLKMSPATGAKATVTAKLGDDETTKVRLVPVEVVSGVPRYISVDLEGTASQLGIGEINIKVTAYDKNYNRVGDDTGVNFRVDGDAIVSGGTSTLNGTATGQIKGGMEPGVYNLTVSVGTQMVIKQFQINALNLEFVGLPERVTSNSTVSFAVKATDVMGRPAANIALGMYTSAGVLNRSTQVTSSAGIAQVEYFTGFELLEAELSARAGLFTSPKKQKVTISPAPGMPAPKLKVERNLILGEAVATEKIEIDRGDGVILRMPYRKIGSIDVNGKENEVVPVELGSLSDPNRQPLFALMMQDLETEALETPGGDFTYKQFAPDALGLHRADAERVELQNKGPYAGEGGSYYFARGAYIRAPSAPELNPQAAALRFDVKLDEHGVLVKHGALEIESSTAGILVKLAVGNTVHVLTGPVLELAAWHSVAVEYKNNQLSLAIDNQLIAVQSVVGEMTYGMSRLTIGGFAGSMRAFKWYDSASKPLVSFEDGSTRQDVLIPVGGVVTLKYHSTGEMNKVLSGAKQAINRVVVQDGGQVQYINLVGRDAYKDFALNYLSTAYQGPEVPAIDYNAYARNIQTGAPFGSFFISPAYALTWADILDSAVDGMIAVAGFVLPIEDFKIVYEQVNLFIANDPKFDVEKLAWASLNVIVGLPIGPTRLLGPLVKPIQLFYKYLGRKPKALKAIVGVMEDLISKAKSRDFDRIYALVPYFIIMAELVSDGETLNFIINSVDGLDDINAWIDYLSLPANDWDGDEAPVLDLAGYIALPPSAGQAYAKLDPLERGVVTSFSLFSQAYASGTKKKAERVLGETLSPIFKELQKVLKDDSKPLVDMMKTVSETMKKGGTPALRKYIFDKQFFVGALTLGQRASQNALRNVIRGFKGMRVHPMLFITSIAYIEEEAANGKLSPALMEKIRGKYVMSLAALAGYESLMEENPRLDVMTPIGIHNGAQGATFQVLATAFYLATGELDDIEVPRVVRIYPNQKARGAGPGPGSGEIFRGLRYVDILLKDDTWVELKSLRASYKDKRDILYPKALEVWNLAKEKSYSDTGAVADVDLKPTTKYHKQFSMDWIATRRGATLPKSGGSAAANPSGIKWWFQKFDVPAKKSSNGSREYSPEIDNQSGGIPDKLMQLPLGESVAIKYSYGAKLTPASKSRLIESFEAQKLLYDELKRVLALPKGSKSVDEFNILDN